MKNPRRKRDYINIIVVRIQTISQIEGTWNMMSIINKNVFTSTHCAYDSSVNWFLTLLHFLMISWHSKLKNYLNELNSQCYVNYSIKWCEWTLSVIHHAVLTMKVNFSAWLILPYDAMPIIADRPRPLVDLNQSTHTSSLWPCFVVHTFFTQWRALWF